ncbi:MAG TPA: SDR family oxidoreductase, partial [Gemmatimonadales bacterium]|nr:SDR family oxidoreductase [Gemmatimonadales bacterium]
EGTTMTTSPRPTALITGASGGIGLELARLCAKGNHDVVLVARNRDKLEEISKYLSGMYQVRVEVLPADLREPGAPASIMEEIGRRGLAVDVLVNNAGFGEWGLFGRGDPQRQLDMIQVNITALTQLTRLALPGMVSRRRGRILNLASTAAFAPGPLMAVYYASKAYVLSFSEAIGNELRGTGITVTALCPGPTRTGFADAAGMRETNLFNSPAVMDAAPVALAGYRGMMRGRAVVIPGIANQLLVLSIRLGPRWLVRRISRWLQERRREQ